MANSKIFLTQNSSYMSIFLSGWLFNSRHEICSQLLSVACKNPFQLDVLNLCMCKTTQKPFEGSLLNSYYNIQTLTLHSADNISWHTFEWHSYTAFLFKYFLSQPAIPKKVQRIPVIQFLDLKVYESTYGLSLTIKWNCNCISNITSCNFILLYFKHVVGFENGTLIGWIWKCWNQLFQFCYLIGFHCLGGHSFSKYAVRQECSYSKDVFSVLDWIYEMTPGDVLPENLGRGVGPASQNPYPIYDQNLWFFPTLFMTWPNTWYPIYDLTLLVAGFI